MHDRAPMTQKSENQGPESAKKPWPMSYILVAILIFALIFNLWLFLGGQ